LLVSGSWRIDARFVLINAFQFAICIHQFAICDRLSFPLLL
jgi:hypothetical protein